MNLGDLAVLLAVAGAVAAAVASLVRRKKKGNSCCGDCSRCGGCEQ